MLFTSLILFVFLKNAFDFRFGPPFMMNSVPQKPLPILDHMPTLVTDYVMTSLDTFSKMNLRLVSKGWQEYVDGFKTEFDDVLFLLGFGDRTNEIEVSVQSERNKNSDLKVIFSSTRNGYQMKISGTQWKKEVNNDDYLLGAATFFTGIVGKQLFTANRLSIKLDDRCYRVNGVPRHFMDIVEEQFLNLGHKIHVKEFYGYGLSYESARFLKYLKPGSLETIRIDTLSEVDPPQAIIHDITEMDQWKQSKLARINGKNKKQLTESP